MREAGDLMRVVNNYAFLVCACGLKIKVPPDFKKPDVSCPRCGRENAVPVAELAAVGALAEAISKGEKAERPEKGRKPEPQIYNRKGHAWESFRCNCGRLIQISPSLDVPSVRCKDCGSTIEIRN